MMNQMSLVPCLEPVFVDAVDGRTLRKEDMEHFADQKNAKRHYGRILRPTEVGCMLSHKKCAELLIDSGNPFSLVLEDDLIWQSYDLEPVIESLNQYLCSEKPRIVLLSGDYWYKRLSPLNEPYKVAHIWDAVCAQAYVINRSGAKKLISIPNWHLADDWFEIRMSGIDVIALFPHIADQNRHDIKSDIAPVYGGIDRWQMSPLNLVRSLFRSFVDKVLVWTRHFESKNFKW